MTHAITKKSLNISPTSVRLDVKSWKTWAKRFFCNAQSKARMSVNLQKTSAIKENKKINLFLFYSTFYILLSRYFTTMKMHWQACRRGCLASLTNPRWTWNIITNGILTVHSKLEKMYHNLALLLLISFTFFEILREKQKEKTKKNKFNL